MILQIVLVIFLSLIHVLKNNTNVVSMILSFLITTIPFVYIIIKNNKKTATNKFFKIIIISSILVFVSLNQFIINYKSNKLTIKNISNEYLIIDNIYLNGNKIKNSNEYIKKYDLINDATFKSEYKSQNKNTKEYKFTLKPNEEYSIDIKNIKDVEINIQKKEKPINIIINNKNTTIKGFNYKEINKKALQMGNYDYTYYYNNTIIRYDIKNVFIILLLLITYFLLLKRFMITRKSSIVALFIYIIELNPIGCINILTKLFLIFIFYFTVMKEQEEIKSYNKKQKLMFLISSLYISFSFVGKYLIENSNLKIIIFYLIISLFIYQMIPILINKIIDIKKRLYKKNENTIKLKYHRIFIICISVIILLIYKFLLSPYIFVTDSYMQAADIFNNRLSNWHPYIHTLILKIFYTIFGNFNSFICFRIIIYSLLLNKILFYFNNKGLKLKYVYLIAILFTLFPVNAIVIITLLKDVDFVIALIALSFYLYLIVNDFDNFKLCKINYLILLILLICVAFFRHNGIYISIIIGTFLFLLSIKKKQVIISITIILFIITAFVIKGPLYKKLNVKDIPKNLDIATIIHGLDYIIVENKTEYNQETYKYLTENILSEKDFKKYYDKYNIDILLHYDEIEDNKKLRNKTINKEKIIKIYLKQFLKSPIYLLKDRLYGTDIIWNVAEDDKINVLKYQLYYDEFNYEYAKNIHAEGTKRNKFIEKILEIISTNDLFNILFFRVGIYIDMLILLINYNVIMKHKKTIVILLPLAINIITLFIAMHYQAFRYVWMIPSITIMYMLITFKKKDA